MIMTTETFFIERFGKVVSDTETQCFAWALIPTAGKVFGICKKGDSRGQEARSHGWGTGSERWRVDRLEIIAEGRRIPEGG